MYDLKYMYDPFQKGRWYRVFMESNGSTNKITESDLEITQSGNNLKMPEGFHVVDKKYDIHSIAHDAQVTIAADLIGYADGCQGIQGPQAKAYDWAYIHVFGYFD